eukprot:4027253-Pyramimonas_sp.AAC.1
MRRRGDDRNGRDTWQHVFYDQLMRKRRANASVRRVSDLVAINPWFLHVLTSNVNRAVCTAV